MQDGGTSRWWSFSLEIAMPHDYPPWQTVHHEFRAWRLEGTWERLNDDLRDLVRKRPVSPACLQPPGGTRH